MTDDRGPTTGDGRDPDTPAIEFGNVLEKNSRVNAGKHNERNYTVLGFLDTKPRVTYLARVRNPNPAMPDFHESPLATEDYMKKNHANPFEAHGHGDHGAPHGEEHAPAAHGEKKGAH